ncbi:MAG: hypothetical protein WD379_03105 [Dehalococcoidia bacterium]
MLTSGRRFAFASFAAWTTLAVVLAPYLILQFDIWGLYVAIDIAIGCTMVTFAGWLVWRFGRNQPNSLRRWGVWLCGWLGLSFTVLVISLEAAIIGGRPIILLLLPYLGALIVPAAVVVGLGIGVFWSSVLRWAGLGSVVSK